MEILFPDKESVKRFVTEYLNYRLKRGVSWKRLWLEVFCATPDDNRDFLENAGLPANIDPTTSAYKVIIMRPYWTWKARELFKKDPTKGLRRFLEKHLGNGVIHKLKVELLIGEIPSGFQLSKDLLVNLAKKERRGDKRWKKKICSKKRLRL